MLALSGSGRRMGKSVLGQWLTLAGYALVVLGPVIVLVAITVKSLATGHLGWLHLAVPTGRRLALFLHSIGLALGVAAAAVTLGWVGAVFLWSWRRQAAAPLVWLMLPLVALPPYIHAMAWLAVTDAIGDMVRPLGLSVATLHGWGGSLWVEVAAFTPLALGCAWLGLRSIDADLIEAGRMARSDLQSLFRIVLPLSAPALLTGGGIVFLLSLLDYSVPSLFQVHVYPMEVFAEFSASNRPERAFLLAVPLVLVAVGVIAMILEPLRTLASRVGLHSQAWAAPPRWHSWAIAVQWVVAILLVVQVLSPFVVMAHLSVDLPRFLTAATQARGELSYSLLTSALAALLSIPLAVAAAHSLLHAGRFSKVWWLLVLAPLAIPASLVGIGFIILSNHLWLQGTVVTHITPALANLARFAPLAVLVVLAQLRRRDPLLLDAAQVFQPAWWRRQIQVAVPLVLPGLLAGAGLVFALSMGELGATLMTVPPGQATLTMRIYSYLHYGASDTVAGLCLVLAVSVLAAGAIAVLAAALWSRLSAAVDVSA